MRDGSVLVSPISVFISLAPLPSVGGERRPGRCGRRRRRGGRDGVGRRLARGGEIRYLHPLIWSPTEVPRGPPRATTKRMGQP